MADPVGIQIDKLYVNRGVISTRVKTHAAMLLDSQSYSGEPKIYTIDIDETTGMNDVDYYWDGVEAKLWSSSSSKSVESSGYSSTDDNADFIMSAINSSTGQVTSAKQTLIIKKPIVLTANRAVNLENVFIQAHADFIGEHMVILTGGIVGNFSKIKLNLDGNNIANLVGFKLSNSKITGSQYQIQVKNLAIGVWIFGDTERQNLEVMAYNCGIAINESEDPEGTLENTRTPDENHIRLSGSNCKQWYIEAGVSSSQINFNVEATTAHTDPCVVITGNKYVTLSGEIRGSNNGGIKIAGGSNLTVNLDNLGVIQCYSGYALDIQSCRHVTGKIVTQRTTYPVAYIGAVTAGVSLDLVVNGHEGGTVLTVGSVAQKAEFAIVNAYIFPINDSSLALEVVNMEDSIINLHVANKGINIPAGAVITRSKVVCPIYFIHYNIPIVNLSAYQVMFEFKGSTYITELEAYSYSLQGMQVEQITNRLGRPANYYDGIWYYDSSATSIDSGTLNVERLSSAVLTNDNGPIYVTNKIFGSAGLRGLKPSINPRTADYTATLLDATILMNAASGNKVITLPTAASAFTSGGSSMDTANQYVVVKTDSSGNTVTMDPNGSELINGSSTFVLTTQYQVVRFQSNGTAWIIV